MIDIKDKQYLALYGVTDRWWVKQKLEKAGVPVTDDALREGLLEDTKAALEGGMTYVQMREKGDPMTEDELLTEALALKALCAEYGVPFVIDDDVELAVKCGADGVHVGQSDMACVEARRALGSAKVVGVSAQTVEQAVQAEADGADYLGVGAVFPTGSKDDADDVSHDTVKAICEAVKRQRGTARGPRPRRRCRHQRHLRFRRPQSRNGRPQSKNSKSFESVILNCTSNFKLQIEI